MPSSTLFFLLLLLLFLLFLSSFSSLSHASVLLAPFSSTPFLHLLEQFLQQFNLSSSHTLFSTAQQYLCNNNISCSSPFDTCRTITLSTCTSSDILCFCLPNIGFQSLTLCTSNSVNVCIDENVCVGSKVIDLGLCMTCASYMKNGQKLSTNNISILNGRLCNLSNSNHTILKLPHLHDQLNDINKDIDNISNATYMLTDENEDICVDVILLQHLDMDEMIFERHQQTTVLCDEHNSCATFGHIVMFYDVPMMMKTYCSQLPNGCVKRVRYVNSPRMMSRMRITTRTEQLVFTPLSAKYQSRTEEMLLSAIVRLGF